VNLKLHSRRRFFCGENVGHDNSQLDLAVMGRKTNKYHPICAAQPKTAKEAKAVAETVAVASDF